MVNQAAGMSSLATTASADSLPAEVLAIVFSKLDLKEDRLAFLGVCRSWRGGCSSVLPSLTVPWPTSSAATSASRAGGAVRMSAGARGGALTEQSMKPMSECVRKGKRTSSSRISVSRGGSSLSLRWLNSALKLFVNVTQLDLTVPVPPEALNAVSLLKNLRCLALVLRPPPAATAAAQAGPIHVLTNGMGAMYSEFPREEKYEAAFKSFISSCTGLQELSISMRACRWEHWPLLSASLLQQLAESLLSLVALHIKSPLFYSHGIGPLLALGQLSTLTLPLDLPHIPAEQCSAVNNDRPLPCLEELHLQPYNHQHRDHRSWRARGPMVSSNGDGGAKAGDYTQQVPSYELPSVLSRLTRLKKLRVGGYGRSPLQRAEFLSNPLSAVPDLSALLRLAKLELCSLKELEFIPATVCSLPALTSLIIQDCPVLLQLPEELGNLGRTLTQLLLHSIGIHNLPQSFTMLTRLSELSLSHLYWLERLPEELGALSAMEDLRITSCKRLPSLPESFSALAGLTSLTATFNIFVLSPSILSDKVHLRSLTVSLSCPEDLEIAPAIVGLPSLEELHVIMADGGEVLRVSGAEIASIVPPSTHLQRVKVEDMRSSSYSTIFQQRENEVGAAHAGVEVHQYDLPHFTVGQFPELRRVKHLHVKCAWIKFNHHSFPALEVLELVLLCSNKSRAAHDHFQGAISTDGGCCLNTLMRGVFSCKILRSFVLFTPDAPDVLSASRCRHSQRQFASSLFGGGEVIKLPPLLQTVLVNDTDLMPYLVSEV